VGFKLEGVLNSK